MTLAYVIPRGHSQSKMVLVEADRNSCARKDLAAIATGQARCLRAAAVVVRGIEMALRALKRRQE
jgi:hypothetical protein